MAATRGAIIHHTRKRIQYPWEVCILATSTPSSLRRTTLRTLTNCGIPRSKITVVVQGKEEEQTFKDQLSQGSYGHLLVSRDVGVAGLINTVYSTFKAGTPLVICRDRIEGLFQLVDGKAQPLKSLIPLFQSMFPLCIHEKVGLWGISSSPKGVSLKDTVVKGVKRISGAMWGILNPGTVPEFSVTMNFTPEFQSIFQVSKVYGGVLRLNSVSAKWSPEKGSKQRDAELERLSAIYPEFAVLHGDSETGGLELRILQDKDNGY